VHLSSDPEDCELLEAWLSKRAERRVQVLVPKRGEKRGLVDLAVRMPASPIKRGSSTLGSRSTTRWRRCAACSRWRPFLAGSNASISRRFREARPWRRWSSARTAGCASPSIGSIEYPAGRAPRGPDDFAGDARSG
jgi:hypothetical protein